MSRLIASVIIPTCNRKELLKKCLDALSADNQEVNSFEYEIIVSDDSKNNETEKFITQDFPRIQYVKGPQKGPATNRNFGATKATGEWLIFIDDDCIPEKTLLNSYINAFKKNEHQVFEGKIIADRERKYYTDEAPLNLNGGKMWSCNIAINKKLFEQLNGFEENFPFAAMEDVELHYRISQKNIPIIFLPDAAVIHPWRPHPGFSIISKRQKSLLYLIAKHPELKRKHNFKWFITSIKNNLALHFKFFKVKDIPFVTLRNFLMLLLYFKILLLNPQHES
ncbi:MAG: glycosyltransferase [Vicingaceae bacterium]|nr:glycosyltransferase [Vicingaceae bacterium]